MALVVHAVSNVRILSTIKIKESHHQNMLGLMKRLKEIERSRVIQKSLKPSPRSKCSSHTTSHTTNSTRNMTHCCTVSPNPRPVEPSFPEPLELDTPLTPNFIPEERAVPEVKMDDLDMDTVQVEMTRKSPRDSIDPFICWTQAMIDELESGIAKRVPTSSCVRLQLGFSS